MVRWTLVLVISSALAAPLHAQQAPTLQLYGGVGLELIGTGDGGDFTPGPTVQLGLVRQSAGSRFGARLDATYYERDRGYVTGYEGSETALGGSATVTYDFGRGAWRPYAAAGAGIYELSAPSSVSEASTPRQATGALIAGFGLRRTLGRLQLFGEMRYHYFTNGEGFVRHILPVTFGVRF
jgi:hypothetical protein